MSSTDEEFLIDLKHSSPSMNPPPKRNFFILTSCEINPSPRRNKIDLSAETANRFPLEFLVHFALFIFILINWNGLSNPNHTRVDGAWLFKDYWTVVMHYCILQLYTFVHLKDVAQD